MFLFYFCQVIFLETQLAALPTFSLFHTYPPLYCVVVCKHSLRLPLAALVGTIQTHTQRKGKENGDFVAKDD